MIRITSKKDGFRRCGIAHSKKSIEYQNDKFSMAELKILKAEPMLVVEVVEEKQKEKTTKAPTAKELAAQVMEAGSVDEINKLLPEGDLPKTLKDAVDRRTKQLSEKAESENQSKE